MPIFELNDVRFKETITDTIVGSDKNAMRMVEIVVRTTDKYPAEICLSAFGKQIEKLDDLRPKPDDKMNIKLTIKSKPSPKGDRYYTSAAIYDSTLPNGPSSLVRCSSRATGRKGLR